MDYLPRKIDPELTKWCTEKDRKPLLIRGARQVGKSSAVRQLSKNFEYFLEINFEEQKQVHSFFKGDLSPHEICDNLSIFYNKPVIPGKTLLFFDEIQACLPAISSLRFFYEKYPELHVIAAGSLLEFALKELPTFGVGRIRSIFMYPFSFVEFLMASGQDLLLKTMQNATPDKPLQEAIHEKLLGLLKQFLILGGMPEVVASYIKHMDMYKCQQILDDLLISLKADFAKYKQQVPALRIREVFESVGHQSGGRFIYSKVMAEANHKQIKEAVDLLIMAGLIIPVIHSSANGIPLGAEINPKKQKMLLFDTGIFQRVLGLNLGEILVSTEFDAINKGAIAELFAGLEIQKSASCYQQENLYFWQREALNSNAEVDYVLQKGCSIFPIEIKSGRKGTMQSLYLFLQEKRLPFGFRCSTENFSEYDRVKVIPLYAISNIKQREE